MNEIAEEKNTAEKPGPTPAETALYEEARHSVVNILASHFHKGKQVMGSAGSGVFVQTPSDKGLPSCELVTDNHVISIDPSLTVELEVQLNDGSKHKAKVLKQDPAHDLAVLKIEGIADPAKTCKPLQLSDREPKPGETFLRLNRTRWESEFFVGTYERKESRSQQELPDLPGEDMNRDLYVFDAYNTVGRQFSGGPFLDKDGKVVAIQEASQSSRKSLATPAGDIIKELDELRKSQ